VPPDPDPERVGADFRGDALARGFAEVDEAAALAARARAGEVFDGGAASEEEDEEEEEEEGEAEEEASEEEEESEAEESEAEEASRSSSTFGLPPATGRVEGLRLPPPCWVLMLISVGPRKVGDQSPGNVPHCDQHNGPPPSMAVYPR